MLPSINPSRSSEGLREPDSPPPPTDSVRRSSSSFLGRLMRRVSGSQPSEAKEEDEGVLSSSGSFGAEMRKRQSLLHDLLNKPNSLQRPSAPSSINSTPQSSPRSSSRSHRPYVGTGLVSQKNPPQKSPSPKSNSISRRSDLMKGFYENEDSSGVSSQYSNPSSLASLVSTNASPISRGRSTGNSSNSSGSGGSSGSERVRSMYIKSFSFEIDMKDLKFRRDRSGDRKMIGEGSYAKILLADWNGTPCAVKRMSATQAGRVALERFQTEIAMMMTLRHPNIVQIFGGCWPPEEDGERYCNLFSTCIVMEYCEMGSLFDVVLKYGNDIPWYPPTHSPDSGGNDVDPMLAAVARAASSTSTRSSLSSLESNVQFKLEWCRQIARGMAYLHSQKNPVMHRDLKSSNVLVSKGFHLKIADFGESRRRHKNVLENMEDTTMSQAGTLLFMAPEMLTEHDYDIKVDVYSFSILLLELFNNGDLINFYQTAPALAMHKVINGWRPDLTLVKRDCKEVADLIELCWCQEPQDRYSFAEILDHLNNIIEDSSGVESRRSSILLSQDEL